MGGVLGRWRYVLGPQHSSVRHQLSRNGAKTAAREREREDVCVRWRERVEEAFRRDRPVLTHCPHMTRLKATDASRMGVNRMSAGWSG